MSEFKKMSPMLLKALFNYFPMIFQPSKLDQWFWIYTTLKITKL